MYYSPLIYIEPIRSVCLHHALRFQWTERPRCSSPPAWSVCYRWRSITTAKPSYSTKYPRTNPGTWHFWHKRNGPKIPVVHSIVANQLTAKVRSPRWTKPIPLRYWPQCRSSSPTDRSGPTCIVRAVLFDLKPCVIYLSSFSFIVASLRERVRATI